MTELTQQQEKNKKELIKAFDSMKPENVLPKKVKSYLKKRRWQFYQWAMFRKYYGYTIWVEFCLGDLCVYPGSKKNGYLLEKKKSCKDFFEAMFAVWALEARIKAGEHWTGEND